MKIDVFTTISLIFTAKGGILGKLGIILLYILFTFKVRYVVMKSNVYRVNDKHCLQFIPRSWHPFIFILNILGFYFVTCPFYMEVE